ncbi:unnamed protein product [Danaus chrysippus]|uniref:(African queen) hypothetical protein n=1 Tax=Danaus chrysippus TaxID=151541 RepID=A0A8J2VX06_9NEOP|nr:unnamed protein product [Danaus chrysippus]
MIGFTDSPISAVSDSGGGAGGAAPRCSLSTYIAAGHGVVLGRTVERPPQWHACLRKRHAPGHAPAERGAAQSAKHLRSPRAD